MTTTVAYLDESAAGWQRSLYAFLGEKQRRSGSNGTVESYSRMLQAFFGRLGKTPDQVTSQDVFPGGTASVSPARTRRRSPSVPGSPA